MYGYMLFSGVLVLHPKCVGAIQCFATLYLAMNLYALLQCYPVTHVLLLAGAGACFDSDA